jgi:ABC-type nitrate/sulfonate/bicarbonate transport system substrate-binding protein
VSGLADLTLGFIPLTDCAPLVVAKAQGFFAEEGLEVALSREASWATIRDKVAVGALDGAHMLAPMALAGESMLAPLALNQNGSAITVSSQAGGDDARGRSRGRWPRRWSPPRPWRRWSSVGEGRARRR